MRHGKTINHLSRKAGHRAALMMNLSLAEGRFLDEDDVGTMAQVCVIGNAVRRDLFGFAPALGRAVKVNERWLTVV